jgi:hypothetical protein
MQNYLVLVRQPLTDVDHDIIFSMQQQIPAAAERAQLVPREIRRAGERSADYAAQLTDPRPYVNSWTNIATNSFRVTMLEPWSQDLGQQPVRDLTDLLHLARLMGTTLGATHHHGEEDRRIEQRLTPDLAGKLRDRSNAYLAQFNMEYERFAGDPKAITDITAAKQAIDAATP